MTGYRPRRSPLLDHAKRDLGRETKLLAPLRS